MNCRYHVLFALLAICLIVSACNKSEGNTPTSVSATATTTPVTIISGPSYPPQDALSIARPELIGEDWDFDVPDDGSGDLIVGYDHHTNCITSYDPVSGMKKELIHIEASRGVVGKPSVYGDKVVYITGQFESWKVMASSLTWPPSSTDFMISMFDMTTGEIINLTMDNHYKACPIIHGDTVLWLDGRNSEDNLNGLFDLYSYNPGTGQEKRLTYTSSITCESLAFNGDWAVWIDERNGSTNDYYDIYAYDLKHNGEKRLTSVSSYNVSNVSISGDYVVWQDDRNAARDSAIRYDYTYNQDIYMYDLSRSKEQQITSYSGMDRDPAIGGHHIVWIRETGERSGDIFAYDINTGQETQVSHSGIARNDPPSIKGNLVLWVDSTRRNEESCTILNGSLAVTGSSLYDLDTGQQTSVRLPDQVWNVWGLFSCQPVIIDKSNVLYTLGDQSGHTWVYAVGAYAGEFAIYGVTHIMTEDQISQARLEDFDLIERPIITIDDIMSYNKETHEIELSQSGLERFNSAAGVVIGQPFVVCVGTERIFSGVFWSAASSLILPGVKIYLFPPTGILISPTLNINFWGPVNETDPMADTRILRSFGHAGKLK